MQRDVWTENSSKEIMFQEMDLLKAVLTHSLLFNHPKLESGV